MHQIIVPYRADPHRDRLLSFTARWRDAVGQTVLAPSPDGPFNRAAALNRAARDLLHAGADVLVIADGDVDIAPVQVKEAIGHALVTGCLTLAFDAYVGFHEVATERILGGEPIGHMVRPSTRRTHESSCVVIPRDVWDRVGGFDERFQGWGQEDVAFVHSVRLLAGPIERTRGPVYHLWHPKAAEKNRLDPLWVANQRLGRRYREARTPQAMQALVDERSVDAGN